MVWFGYVRNRRNGGAQILIEETDTIAEGKAASSFGMRTICVYVPIPCVSPHCPRRMAIQVGRLCSEFANAQQMSVESLMETLRTLAGGCSVVANRCPRTTHSFKFRVFHSVFVIGNSDSGVFYPLVLSARPCINCLVYCHAYILGEPTIVSNYFSRQTPMHKMFEMFPLYISYVNGHWKTCGTYGKDDECVRAFHSFPYKLHMLYTLD